jgi:hypothetical protein
MGVDDLVDKAKDLISGNKDMSKDAVEKAGDMVDEKTEGKYSEHVDKGQEAAKDYIDKLPEE